MHCMALGLRGSVTAVDGVFRWTTMTMVQLEWRRTWAKRIPFDDDEQSGRRRTTTDVGGVDAPARQRNSLYDVLGITPKATQGEIKAAYYRLSKTFHPDRNKDSDEAIRKFRDIADAYGVLGSHGTRRRYDRGFMTVDIGGVVHGEQEEDAIDGTMYRRDVDVNSGRPDNSTPAVGYRSGVYNFDEWTKNHYGTMLERDIHIRQQVIERRRKAEQVSNTVTSRLVELYTFIVMFAIVAFFGIFMGVNNYDIPSNSETTTTKKRKITMAVDDVVRT